MRLIKGIFCKIDHLVIDMICHLLINAIVHTAYNPFLCISINEVFPFLLHHLCFLLAHGPAHQIASAHGIAGQITDDLHHLLLVDDTAVGGA